MFSGRKDGHTDIYGHLFFIISQLRLCIQAEGDSVVAFSADRDAAGENKYCDVLGPGEHLSEAEPFPP